MRRSDAKVAILFLCGLLPDGPALGGDADRILDQTPLPVQPANPATDNDQPTGFGSAVALDQNLLAVGSPDEDSAGLNNSGAVRVFERRGAAWVETQTLTAEAETAFEGFGHSVGIARGDDGLDFLVVGVPFADGSRGRADVFRRENGGVWQLEASLGQEDPEPGDRYGEDVAIDFFQPPNDPDLTGPIFVIAVGAPNNDGPDSGDTDRGSLSIHQRPGGVWVSIGQEFFGENNSDLLGSSVAMAGPIIVAGGTGMDATPSGSGFNSGGGQFFEQANLAEGGGYHYAANKKLYPTDGQMFAAGMGLSAALGGAPTFLPIAVLGAPLHDDGGAGANFGKVYIYEFSFKVGDRLFEDASLQPPGLSSGAMFGTSIDLSLEGVLAVGAPGVVPDGAVFIYEIGEEIETWSLVGQLTIPDPVPAEQCRGGEGIALQGLTAVAGCPSSNTVQNDFVFVYFGGIFADGFESGFGPWSSKVP